jgi:hypothetical protein
MIYFIFFLEKSHYCTIIFIFFATRPICIERKSKWFNDGQTFCCPFTEVYKVLLQMCSKRARYSQILLRFTRITMSVWIKLNEMSLSCLLNKLFWSNLNRNGFFFQVTNAMFIIITKVFAKIFLPCQFKG